MELHKIIESGDIFVHFVIIGKDSDGKPQICSAYYACCNWSGNCE